MSTAVEGFEVPLHQALTQPLLLGGAPRGLALVNGTLAAALGLGLQLWTPGLLLWVAGHTLAVFAAKHDPYCVAVTLRHLRHKGYFSC
ncbi:VirB3 family type IV secretion system protein [Asticcacaulis sp. AND118]|uniref:VirB3 family type IV secretion system protein n=1 Tax=Asticcacaulis sp. AND118 TaxID=2840468 RepID=UPI001D000484|nr:VirB3 family type IV secretion system protein [Asticcacaulis sp. AND118]UDF04847.1 VirB3 family type IV secretion system protein [Asticcacaulis sp. AND118]